MKKLSLNKETVISLNNQEMLALKGGTGWACIRAGVGTVMGAYLAGRDESFWHCQQEVADGGEEGGGGATGGCVQNTMELCNP